jgi:hypothetical protein
LRVDADILSQCFENCSEVQVAGILIMPRAIIAPVALSFARENSDAGLGKYCSRNCSVEKIHHS